MSGGLEPFMSEPDDDGSESIKERGPEVAVAAILVALALVVIADSLRVGIGWAEDGPRSGYFPFYIGLLLLASSGTILIKALIGWRSATAPFVKRSELSDVMAVLVPMLIYIGVMNWTGIYLASVVLIGYFMRRHGKFGWPLCASVAVGVPLTFFIVFERWFLVPLPKGPFEALFGL
jgi:hypothetical protein